MMYEYTLNPDILRILKKREHYFPENTWKEISSIATRIVPMDRYNMTIYILKYGESFKYCSPKRLKRVPFCGYLIPVTYFKETHVQNI